MVILMNMLDGHLTTGVDRYSNMLPEISTGNVNHNLGSDLTMILSKSLVIQVVV